MEFEITHPFHPDRGRRLQMLLRRFDRGAVWLWYADHEGKPRKVKLDITDRAKPDAFQQQARGRCLFQLQDLVQLVEVVTRLARRGNT